MGDDISDEQRTVLFVDVCDSTKLLAVLGDHVGRAVVTGCLDELRRTAETCGGSVLKEIGDELMMTFHEPAGAARGACAMQVAIAEAAASGLLPPGTQVRIGFHHGPLILAAGDISGTTVHLARRVASVSKAQQIVTSRQTLDLIPDGAGIDARFLDRSHVKGHDEVLEMHEILWDAARGTIMEPDVARPAESHEGRRLALTHAGSTLEIGATHPVVTVGRDAACDYVVDHPKVSRLHGRFEYRRSGFVFVDASTNGSYVELDGDAPQFIRRDEALLPRDGTVRLGSADADAPALRFALVTAQAS